MSRTARACSKPVRAAALPVHPFPLRSNGKTSSPAYDEGGWGTIGERVEFLGIGRLAVYSMLRAEMASYGIVVAPR